MRLALLACTVLLSGCGGAAAGPMDPLLPGGGDPVPSSGCGRAAAPGAQTRTLTVGGRAREYGLRIPTGYDPSTPTPLMFSFHGAGATGPQAVGTTPVIAGVTAIAVGPTSGDLPFVQALLEAVSAELCVDRSRVFMAGYSAGGFLASSLGCQMHDAIRGIAVLEGGGGGCAFPVPIWFVHNQDDATVPISYGMAARDAWLAANGCSGATAPMTILDQCVRYTGCQKAPVAWCSPATGGHRPSYALWASIAEFWSSL